MRIVRFLIGYELDGIHYEPGSLVEMKAEIARKLKKEKVTAMYDRDGKPEPDDLYKIVVHE